MRLLICAAVLGVPAAASAQGGSHWGVGGSIVPRWEFLQPIAELMDIATDAEGSEMRIGVVRGRDLGGDWGVMFIRKKVDDGSIWQLGEGACVQTTPAASVCTRGTYHLTRNAQLTGVEIYRFIPFGTIARRVQPGVTIAGGIGRLEGETDRFIEHLQVSGTGAGSLIETLGPGLFRETVRDFEVIPIGRVEVGVGVIVAPGLKVRVSAGVSFPSVHVFSVHAHYLFGAR